MPPPFADPVSVCRFTEHPSLELALEGTHFADRVQEVGMSESLTLIERRIYNYLIDYLKRETYQPSIREIGTRFGIRSTKTVTEHLQSLQRKGYLDRTPSRSRALRIHGLDLSPDTLTIPVYRNARREEDDLEARYDLDRSFACSADCFMVYAEHDAHQLGILADDLILVDPAAEPRPGDLLVRTQGGSISVVRAGDEGTATGASENGASSGIKHLGVGRTVVRRLATHMATSPHTV